MREGAATQCTGEVNQRSFASAEYKKKRMCWCRPETKPVSRVSPTSSKSASSSSQRCLTAGHLRSGGQPPCKLTWSLPVKARERIHVDFCSQADLPRFPVLARVPQAKKLRLIRKLDDSHALCIVPAFERLLDTSAHDDWPPYLVTMCVVTALTSNARFHAAFGVLSLTYQVSWFLRLYDVIGD